MAGITISGPKDLIGMPVLIAGAGGVVGLVGGDVLGGVIAGAIPQIDINNPGHMTAVKAGTKIGLGVVGAFVAKQPGNVGNFGAGLAFGGLLGAFSDLVNYGIVMSGTATTGATAAERLGLKLVKGGRRMAPYGAASTGRAVYSGPIVQGLEILPRD